MTNYKKKHKFEDSGLLNGLGKPECKCGLPESIFTMHFVEEKVEGGDWRTKFDKKFTQPEINQPNNWREGASAKEIKQYIQQLLDSALREQADSIEKKMQPAFDDFTEAGKRMIESRTFGKTGNEIIENVGYMKGVFWEIKSKYLPKKGSGK